MAMVFPGWDHLTMAEEGDWWTTAEASSHTGLHRETIGNWARNGRVESEPYNVGKRSLLRVKTADVVREAKLSQTYGHRRGAPLAISTPPSRADLTDQDRGASLEEIARRQRKIEEHHEEIERHLRAINQQHREIEEMLLAPSWAPHD